MEIVKDGKNILVNGRVFKDRRMGITFPGPNNTGYLCLFGLEDVETTMGYSPLVLLAERTESDRDKFFNKILGVSKRWSCSDLYADMDKTTESLERSFSSFFRGKNVRGVRLFDAGEWSDFQEALPAIVARARRGMLELGKKTILKGQYDGMTPDDLHTREQVLPNERWFAVNAMNHVVLSYELFPVPKKKEPMIYKRGVGYR